MANHKAYANDIYEPFPRCPTCYKRLERHTCDGRGKGHQEFYYKTSYYCKSCDKLWLKDIDKVFNRTPVRIVASPEQLAVIQKETRKRLAAAKRQDRERKLANSLEWAR